MMRLTGRMTGCERTLAAGKRLPAQCAILSAQVCEPTPLPKSGTQAVRFKAVTTQHLVLRGWFQTLPIAVYGQRLGPDPAQQARRCPTCPFRTCMW